MLQIHSLYSCTNYTILPGSSYLYICVLPIYFGTLHFLIMMLRNQFLLAISCATLLFDSAESMSVCARSVSERMATLLVNQANRELDASRMYLAMDMWFRFHDFPGSASWCQTHSVEERSHAMKIFDHLALRQTEKVLSVSQEVLSDHGMEKFQNNRVSEVWKKALDQEVQNSQEYFNMAKVAEEESDYVSREFLNWFLNEQLMEENAVEDLYRKAIKLEKTGGLYVAIDKDMRVMDH